jgi:hypothetical protein
MHFSSEPFTGAGTLAGPTNHPSARAESYDRIRIHWVWQFSSRTPRVFK